MEGEGVAGVCRVVDELTSQSAYEMKGIVACNAFVDPSKEPSVAPRTEICDIGLSQIKEI